MIFTLSMSAFSINEGTLLHKKIDIYESIGFSFDNKGRNSGPVLYTIETLEELKDLQSLVGDELIIDFNNMNIEIYNSWRE